MWFFFYVVGFLATFSITIYKLKGNDQGLVKKSKLENNSHSKKSIFLIMPLTPVSKYELGLEYGLEEEYILFSQEVNRFQLKPCFKKYF